MSYCQFQNTLNDLQDCLESLTTKPFSDLSKDEQKARNELVELCKKIAKYYEVEEVKSQFH